MFDLFDYLKLLKTDIEGIIKDSSDTEKALFLNELAMWALKAAPQEPNIKGTEKTKIIRAFFGRYKPNKS
jgi:hypothetical protein